MNRLEIGLGLIASLWAISAMPTFAAAPPAIRESVAVCDVNAPNHCAAPDSSGALPVTGTFTPRGTQDVNITKIGGNAVTTTVPISGTLTGVTNPVGVKGADGATITSTTNPFPVTGTQGVVGATSTDASGTITLGGTYQSIIASSATRKGCLVQNPSTATEVLLVKVGTMASPFTVSVGGSFSCNSPGVVVTDVITATATTTTHAFSAVFQ